MNSKNYLIKVYEDTIKFVTNNNKFHSKITKNYDICKIVDKLPEDFLQNYKKNTENECIIQVVKEDTLNCALNLNLNEDDKILVLNMASNIKPGGGVENGSLAQEEEIFRRTTIFSGLNPSFYPLKITDILYSDDIYILKDDKYEYLNEFKKISIVSVSAIRSPKLVSTSFGDNKYNKNDFMLMDSKIESIFRIGIAKGCNKIVLGAFGCGIFNNPPQEVAQIFKKYTNIYKEYFAEIKYAILGENYEIFKQII